ncbi:MAG: DUF1841 family protein [Saprospiraceae bacterium]
MNFDAIIFQYLETVNRQLQENKPPEVGLTLRRLMNEGYSEKEARHLIAQCVAAEMYQVMLTDTPYNEARYVQLLQQLPNEPEIK